MGNALQDSCPLTGFLPSSIQDLRMNFFDRASIIPMKNRGDGLTCLHFESNRLFPLKPYEIRQFGTSTERKHSGFIVLGSSRLKTDSLRFNINLRPSECEHFARHTPAS